MCTISRFTFFSTIYTIFTLFKGIQISATVLKVGSWASLSKPQYSQEWYVRQVHENLLNKNDLPHTAYTHPIHKSILKEYSLPHTVAVHREHESLQKVYGLPHRMVHTLLTRKLIEGIRFTPHCC